MNDDKHSHDGASERASGAAETSAPGAEARARLEEMAAPLRDHARNVAEQQKTAGAEQLAHLGHAVHGAASGLEQELPQAARLVHLAADKLESASSQLRERSVRDLVGLFNDFARRQPAAAFAGSLLAGLTLSRFLKSSSADPRSEGGEHGLSA